MSYIKKTLLLNDEYKKQDHPRIYRIILLNFYILFL